MSDIITGPGFYKQQNGGKAEVCGQSKLDGRWYGRPACTATGHSWNHDGTSTAPSFNIVSAWIPEPPAPPPGFVVMPRNVKPYMGCQRWSRSLGWSPLMDDSYLEGSAEYWDSRSAAAPIYFASPIPKPFRISEHGVGVYETRDGREATVFRRFGDGWAGPDLPSGFEWYDDGRRDSFGERPNDLVRYLRPLPQPEWTPTNERPPLGLRPRFIADEQRLDELKAAIRRFRDAKRKVPRDWYEEMFELLERPVTTTGE